MLQQTKSWVNRELKTLEIFSDHEVEIKIQDEKDLLQTKNPRNL